MESIVAEAKESSAAKAESDIAKLFVVSNMVVSAASEFCPSEEPPHDIIVEIDKINKIE